MTTKRIAEVMNANKEYLNFINWPMVLLDNILPEAKETFLNRKKAVEKYLSWHPVHEISRETGIERHEITRLVKRCLKEDSHGRMWGYRALIPQKRVGSYNRIRFIKSGDTKFTGAFKHLLSIYPIIEEKITTYYLNKNQGTPSEPNIKIKYLHKYFLDLCRSVNLTHSDYPFTTENKARRSLYRFVKEIENNNLVQAAKRSNEEASRHARVTGLSKANNYFPVRPFERVEFDGHRLDVMLSITYTTADGDEITEVIDRIWLLLIVDVATKAILGYHLCLNREYSASDILYCIKNAVEPKKLKQLTISGLKYPDKIGFHSLVVPETEWAVWDELCYDNAKSNLSNLVIDRLTQIVGCSVNAGPVATPERRPHVERLFGVLEENGYHRLVSTTGSNPKDPRRQDPEKKAIEYKICVEHLEELTEIFIAIYNTTPHEGINNISPMECLRQRISRGMYPRCIPSEEQNSLSFLTLRDKRLVKGDIRTGKRPFIYYEGVEYRNDVLSRSPNLIGIKLDILVNIDDIRVIRAFLPDGSEFGLLTAAGKWGVKPHSLKLRKIINRLKDRKEIHFSYADDPVEIYHRYLEATSGKSKVQRNRLAELRRKLSNEDKSQLGDNTTGIQEKTPDTADINFDISKFNFKTITY